MVPQHEGTRLKSITAENNIQNINIYFPRICQDVFPPKMPRYENIGNTLLKASIYNVL